MPRKTLKVIIKLLLFDNYYLSKFYFFVYLFLMPNINKINTCSPPENNYRFFVDRKLSTRYLKEYRLFGAPMPGRNYTGTSYRYGMNGQEKDDEIAQGIYTAEYWEYDSRTGRRWNIDPIIKYWESPYACFNNNPIFFADPSGLDGEPANKGDGVGKKGDGAINGGTKNGDGSVSGGNAVCIGCGDRGEDIYGLPSDNSNPSASLSSVTTGNNTINNSPRTQYESQFVFELSTKVDIGPQLKAKAGVASAKIDLFSFELARGKLDFAKMMDNNKYADDDDSVTGSFILNGDGRGVNVESSLELEAKLPISVLGQDIGLGFGGKQTFNTNDPYGTLNRDYDVLVGVTVLKKTTDQAIGKLVNKAAFEAMGGIDPAGSIKGKVGKKQEFEGLDLGFGAAFILGFDINFKLGHVYTEK